MAAPPFLRSLPLLPPPFSLSAAHSVHLVNQPPKLFERIDDISYRKWKDKEDQILRDIEPIILLAKEILHSDSEPFIIASSRKS
ncbi:Ubiquitin-conjugating enzyme E2 variant 3 [Bienertia sinuspersici]